MDTMPSSEFRKRYASLTQATMVTVNGHVIGKWTPGNPYIRVLTPEENARAVEQVRQKLGEDASWEPGMPPTPHATYTGVTDRPIRPVPKPSKRR